MTEGNKKEQLDKEMEQFFRDLKELDKKIEIIGKRGKLGKGIAPDDLKALLIKDDGLFELSSSLEDHYDIR